MLERYDPRNWPISYDGVIHTLIVLGSAVALALLACTDDVERAAAARSRCWLRGGAGAWRRGA